MIGIGCVSFGLVDETLLLCAASMALQKVLTKPFPMKAIFLGNDSVALAVKRNHHVDKETCCFS